MTGRRKRPGCRRNSWLPALLALLCAFALHAVWLTAPQARVEKMSAPPAMKAVAYPRLDTYGWSPTLFSLPSPLGFSGAIRFKASNVLPPLKSPLVLTSPLQVDLESFFPEEELRLDLPVSYHTRLPLSTFDPPAPQPAADPVYTWSFEVLEGESAVYEVNRLPEMPVPASGFSVTGTMTFDRAGLMSSLVLDPASLTEKQRNPVLRSLRRVRRMKGTEPTRIRFRFSYFPTEEEDL